jgi:hypothetical protein
MQTAPAWIARLFAMASICAGPAFAADEGPTQFDLICNGMVDGKALGSTSSAFTAHLRVDLKRNVFCREEYCGNFSQQNESMLAYHCKVEPGGQFCGPRPQDSAGPFISSDDFIIDRSTGWFHQESSGFVGDRVGRRFGASYSGYCVTAAFSGLSPSPAEVR